ncbi:MAG: hypothetical protein LBG20_01300 [Holosporaceae bacterium]|jgi:predicted Zn-dependent peptidase|nr:hypothetical protein [Holosporaceae bacterium]
MIRALVIVLLLFFQISFGEPSRKSAETRVKKCVLSNGVNMVLHENFRMPVVIVGMILHTGYFNTPRSKQGITDLIEENFISPITHLQLQELGISCTVHVDGSYTEIFAIMNPKHLKNFFQIIEGNEFAPRNLDILKKHIITKKKLIHSCFLDAISNEITANIGYKTANVDGIFNEKIFSTISEKDLREYFDQHYKTSRISLVVVGAIGYKNLIKVLQSTVCSWSSGESPLGDLCTNTITREIKIRSKYVGRTLLYLYKIPWDDLPQADAFFDLLDLQVFRYLQKAYPVVASYASLNVISNGDCIYQVILRPKSDVSMDELQQKWEILIDRVSRQEMNSEFFETGQQWKRNSQQIMYTDWWLIYQKIKYNLLNRIETEVEINSSKQFNSLGEKILKNSMILKIDVQNRMDR